MTIDMNREGELPQKEKALQETRTKLLLMALIILLVILLGCSEGSLPAAKHDEDRRVQILFPGGLGGLGDIDLESSDKDIAFCTLETESGSQTQQGRDTKFIDCMKDRGYEVVISYPNKTKKEKVK